MAILTGLILLVLMVGVLLLIERYVSLEFTGELQIFPLLIMLFAAIIGWQLNEHIVTEWLNLKYESSFITKGLQCIHAVLALAIAKKGFFIGVVIMFIFFISYFLKWLFTG
ncbi:hypothetical protein [Pseudoalteromonas prydzensis]|uniref:hypothetical protein n=1 Tax=Pseudoalteromonas prydzensis TaxID=182141 RepID=UPI003FD1C269